MTDEEFRAEIARLEARVDALEKQLTVTGVAIAKAITRTLQEQMPRLVEAALERHKKDRA